MYVGTYLRNERAVSNIGKLILRVREYDWKIHIAQRMHQLITIRGDRLSYRPYCMTVLRQFMCTFLSPLWETNEDTLFF